MAFALAFTMTDFRRVNTATIRGIVARGGKPFDRPGFQRNCQTQGLANAGNRLEANVGTLLLRSLQNVALELMNLLG